MYTLPANRSVIAIVSLAAGALTQTTVAQVVSSQAEYETAFAARAERLVAGLDSVVAAKAKAYRTREGAPENPANVMTTKGDRLDLFESAILIRHGIDPELGNKLIRQQAASPFRGGMFFIHDVMAALAVRRRWDRTRNTGSGEERTRRASNLSW